MNKYRKIILSMFMAVVLVLPIVVRAQGTAADQKLSELKTKAASELNQFPTTNPQAIIGLAVRALMMFMGAIMFGLVVYAGIIWMSAQGNTEKISKAKNIIIWSALGVTVMLISYIVVNFVLTTLTEQK
jgi:ABC-type oligopeptide transport system substrate-binding subunit